MYRPMIEAEFELEVFGYKTTKNSQKSEEKEEKIKTQYV
jgi:hypothetical protein